MAQCLSACPCCSSDTSSRCSPPAPGLTGATPAASRVKTCVHAAFYVWVTLQNVLATSIMWSRLADVFGPEAGARLFGVIGAGATAGQLVPPPPPPTCPPPPEQCQCMVRE